ncbi:MAG: O-antigen ligase family protein [Pyrinomonadaceae bacterium]
MTTSISNELAAHDSAMAATPETAAVPQSHTNALIERTLASRLIILLLCLAIVLSALAFGTVHGWALAAFQLGAGLIGLLWMMDAWRTRALRVSRNALQWPLFGLIVLGAVQLLPFGGGTETAGTSASPRSLSLDPYATRFALLQLLPLLIYFAATFVFVNSPQRLRLLVRTIIIFGFLLAGLGLIQYFTAPRLIYWVRPAPTHAVPFGPFFNSHHFAGYMELTLALPLGLLMSGAVPGERRLLYAFAVAMMGIALIMTGSRGATLSFVAEAFFVMVVSSLVRRRQDKTEDAEEQKGWVRAVALRLALGIVLLLTLFTSLLFFGGEVALNRLVGTVSAEDPSNGRLHYWGSTLDMIRDHPLTGIGLGAFGVTYTRYDTSNGFYRLEQAHNDYLQILADAGVIGASLGLVFIILLFYRGLACAQSGDDFRRGIAVGALAGCFAVLIHSFFDFTLHTTSNALLFLLLAALATLDGRVEQPETNSRRSGRHQRSRRKHRSGA